MRLRVGMAAVVLAAGLLPVAAGAQSAPEPAQSEPESEPGSESGAGSVVEALGGVVVLDGTVTFSSGVSGASGGSGFAGYSSGGGGIGALEVSSVDGTVFGDASQVYALAQIAGAVDVGPAVGTTDAALLTVAASVDLSDGFWLVVGNHLLSSDGATVPVGELNSTGGLRYWLWNAPCKDWELDDTVPVSIVTFGEDPAARWADTSLDGLGLTGAALDTAFDPATLSYTATAPAGNEQVTIDALAPLACDLDISPADADAGAEGHQVDLGYLGSQTTVTVTVTAPDGDTAGQHTVQIFRDIARTQTRSPAQVEALSIDAVPDLDFESTQTRHEATVPAGTASTQIDAVPVEGTQTDAWTITAGDTAATPVGADGTVTLTPGADTVVAVRAATEHNESQRIYTVRLTTPPAADPPPQQTQQGTRTETANLASRLTGTPADTWRTGSARSVTGGWHNDRLGGWGDRTYRSSNSNSNSGNAAPPLSALTVDPGILDPAFAADTFHYDVAVTHDTEQITIAPTAAPGATAVITPTDADSDTAGHQIALNAPVDDTSAQTAVLITVTAGTRMDAYTITVTRAAAPTEHRDISLGWPDRIWQPRGLWGDGETLWLADATAKKLFAYTLATGTRDRSKDMNLVVGGLSAHDVSPHGIWSDGRIIWVAMGDRNHVRAYRISGGTFGERVPQRDFTATANRAAHSLASDGTHLWVGDSGWSHSSTRGMNAYRLSDGTHVAAKDFSRPQLAQMVGRSTGVKSAWIDAAHGIVWTSPVHHEDVYAHSVADDNPERPFRSRQFEWEFEPPSTSCGCEWGFTVEEDVFGMWSDGTTMWMTVPSRSKIVTTVLPVPPQKPRGLTATPGLGQLSLSWNAHTSQNEGSSPVATYEIESRRGASGPWTRHPDPEAGSTQAALRLDDIVEYTVRVRARNAQGASPWAETTGTPSELSDADTPNPPKNVSVAFGTSPGSFVVTWEKPDPRTGSDGQTPVAEPTEYLLRYRDAQFSPRSAWGEETVMIAETGTSLTWSISGLLALTPYEFSVQAQNAAGPSEASTAGKGGLALDGLPLRGVGAMWSNSDTIWISDAWWGRSAGTDKLYAFDMVTGQRKPSEDFDDLDDAGIDYVSGLWSDGTTMWVVGGYGYNQHSNPATAWAFTMSDKSRDADKDIANTPGGAISRDVWSDGSVLWTVDGYGSRIVAHDLTTGTRLESREFSLQDPLWHRYTGLWSDGDTMWVVDNRQETQQLYAFDLESGERLGELEAALHHPLSDSYISGTTSLWSDGSTAWTVHWGGVNDDYRYAIVAFRLPG